MLGAPAMVLSPEQRAVNSVLVVGGGLGGLAAAIHLRKRGIDAQVYEKNPSISGGEGTLISIFPNGCRALHDADPELVAKMRNQGLQNFPATGVTKTGDPIFNWELSTQMEERYGQPIISILWKDALRILSEAVPDNCKHTGYECCGLTQEEDGAVAHFMKGEEQVQVKASLVIGADGIRSRVRTALFGPIVPRDNGRTMWRAVIDSSLCSHKSLERPGNVSSAADGRTVFVVNQVHGKLYWAMSVTDDVSEGLVKVRSKSQEEMKERVLEFYKGWELATHIIQATDADLILERRVTDLPVLQKWWQDSAVLLGDSVHAVTPSLGQGANMAFEDARELAFQLSNGVDLRDALGSYEAVRSPRAEKISEASQRPGQSQEFYDWLYTYDGVDGREFN